MAAKNIDVSINISHALWHPQEEVDRQETASQKGMKTRINLEFKSVWSEQPGEDVQVSNFHSYTLLVPEC